MVNVQLDDAEDDLRAAAPHNEEAGKRLQKLRQGDLL
jgi:hypothetical protein